MKKRSDKYNKILENLKLLRYKDDIVVKSDLEDKTAASRETFKHKNKLKMSGFNWDPTLSLWKMQASELKSAQDTINAINKIEKFVDALEELEELIINAEDPNNLANKAQIDQKIDGFINKLSSEVDEVAASQLFRDYLKFSAKFHKYSQANTLLIYLQKRNATHVAGYHRWRTKLGRQVKKGAKSIAILAPKIKIDKDLKKLHTDDSADTPEYAPEILDDSPLHKKINKITGFIVVDVFDISDTEPIPGKEHFNPLKWHADDEPHELASKLYDYVLQVVSILGINLTQDRDRSGAQGYSTGDHINLTSHIDGVNKVATLIHEVAHSLLHFKSSLFYKKPTDKYNKNEVELQAESVSYVVLSHYGLPVEHQSTYAAMWRASSDNVKNNMEVIKKASRFIIDKIDEVAKSEEKKQNISEIQGDEPDFSSVPEKFIDDIKSNLNKMSISSKEQLDKLYELFIQYLLAPAFKGKSLIMFVYEWATELKYDSSKLIDFEKSVKTVLDDVMPKFNKITNQKTKDDMKYEKDKNISVNKIITAKFLPPIIPGAPPIGLNENINVSVDDEPPSNDISALIRFTRYSKTIADVAVLLETPMGDIMKFIKSVEEIVEFIKYNRTKTKFKL